MANQPLNMFVDDPAKAQTAGVAPPAGGIIAGAQGQPPVQQATPPSGIIGSAQVQPASTAQKSVATQGDINGAYQSLFGRPAEEGGMAFWQDAATKNGWTPEQTRAAIAAGAQTDDVSAEAYLHGGGTLDKNWQGSLSVDQVGNSVHWDAVKGKWVEVSQPAYQAAQLGNPTQWNVTADQTVQGQMKNLIDPNSPYYQQWATAGAADAAARGFTGNSSIRDTSILDSVMRGATPIATSDAGTYAKAAGYNADMSNQFAMKNADLSQQMALAHLSSDTQKYLGNLSATTQQAVQQMSSDSQKSISQAHDANSVLIQGNQAAAQAYQTYVNAVASIDIQPGMDEAAKRAAIITQTQIFNNAISGLRAGSSSTPDVSSPLDISAQSVNAGNAAAQEVGGVDVSGLLQF